MCKSGSPFGQRLNREFAIYFSVTMLFNGLFLFWMETTKPALAAAPWDSPPGCLKFPNSFARERVRAPMCICIRMCVFVVCVCLRKRLYFLSNNIVDFLAVREYDYCFSTKNRGVLCWRIDRALKLSVARLSRMVISPFANRPIMEKWIQETVRMNMESLVSTAVIEPEVSCS